MNEIPAHEILARLFAVVVEEAKKSPTLAKKLIEAFPEAIVAKTDKPRPAQGFDASGYHAINILRTHGEGALRGKLEQIKEVKNLKAVATASGLVLSGPAIKARAPRTVVIDAIISAAKHYDLQRRPAAE